MTVAGVWNRVLSLVTPDRAGLESSAAAARPPGRPPESYCIDLRVTDNNGKAAISVNGDEMLLSDLASLGKRLSALAEEHNLSRERFELLVGATESILRNALEQQRTIGASFETTIDSIRNAERLAVGLVARMENRQVAAVEQEVHRWHRQYSEFAQQWVAAFSEDGSAPDVRYQPLRLDFALARAQFDMIAGHKRRKPEFLAHDCFTRAVTYALEFNVAAALRCFEQAYSAKAEYWRYALEFGEALELDGHRVDAMRVYEKLLPQLRDLVRENISDFGLLLVRILDFIGGLDCTGRDPSKHADVYRERIEIRRRLAVNSPEKRLGFLQHLWRYAQFCRDNAGAVEAATAYKEGVELARTLAQEHHRYSGELAGWLAFFADQASRCGLQVEAEAAFLEGLLLKRKLAEDSAAARMGLAFLLLRYSRHCIVHKRPEEAEAAWREALDTASALAGEESGRWIEVAQLLGERAHDCGSLGRPAEADAAYREALEILRSRDLGEGKVRDSLVWTLLDYARHCRSLGREDEAKATEQEQDAVENAPHTLYRKQQRDQRILELPGLRAAARSDPSKRLDLANALTSLAFFCGFEYVDDVRPALEEALSVWRDLAKDRTLASHRQLLKSMRKLAYHLKDIKCFDEAESLLREASETENDFARKNLGSSHWVSARDSSGLANLYVAADRVDQAEARYKEAIRDLRQKAQVSTAWRVRLAETLDELGQLYVAAGRDGEGAAVFNEGIEVRRALARDGTIGSKVDLALALYAYGHLCRRARRQDGVDAAFEELLVVWRKLRNCGPYEMCADVTWRLQVRANWLEEDERCDDAARLRSELRALA